MRIFVGNLPAGASEGTARSLFEDHGDVLSVKPSQVSMGVANPRFIVEMRQENGIAAIRALDGSDFNGCRLNVWEAMQNEPKPKKKPVEE